MPRFALASLLLVLGCSSPPRQRTDVASGAGAPPSDTAAAAAGIDSLKARFFEAYNQDDPKAIAETYSEDVNFILDGMLLHGRAAVEQGWKDNMKALSGLKFTPVERLIQGDMATLTERFEQQYTRPNGKTVTDSGYYVAVVRREAGGWRWHTLLLSRPPEKP